MASSFSLLCLLQSLFSCIVGGLAGGGGQWPNGGLVNKVARMDVGSHAARQKDLTANSPHPTDYQTRHDHGILLQQLIDRYGPSSARDQSEQDNTAHSAEHHRPSRAGTRHVKSSADVLSGLDHVYGDAWSAHNRGDRVQSISKVKHARLRRRETSNGVANNHLAPESAIETPSVDHPPKVHKYISKKDARVLMKEISQRPGSTSECNTKGPILALQNTFPDLWLEQFHNCTVSVVRTANVLNNIFRAWDSHPTSLYNNAFYYSLAKAFLADEKVAGATIAFDSHQYLLYPGSGDSATPGTFAPFVKRDRANPSHHEALDIAELTKDKYTANGTHGYDWFWKQRKTFSDVLWTKKDMCIEVNPNDVAGSYGRLPSVITTAEEGMWTDAYYDCNRSRDWVVTYSVPFFGCNNYSQLLFKGVVAIDVALRTIDINQCDGGGITDVFSGTHKCKDSTECVFAPGHGLKMGGYNCLCRPGFYLPSSSNSQKYFKGQNIEDAYEKNRSFIGYECDRCGKGCAPDCHNNKRCYVNYDVMIRIISIGVVSFCMSMCLVLVIVIIRMRKTKVMKASMWILLELILLGSLMLYSTVIIQYFEPTNLMCILVPWFREVGFAMVYGAVVLKIYRILSEFQSRKAHRVYVRDKDLLKYLFTIVLIVVGFMAAWTALNLDYILKNDASMLANETLPDTGMSFVMCRQMWWEYIIELGEFLLLVFAIYLCYRTRSAPSDFNERRYLAMVIYNETIISTVTHIVRHFLWGIIHPDYIFLMYFIRCQLTVSLLIILIIGSKLWYAHRPPEDDHFRNRAYSSSDVQDNVLPESMKLHAGVNSNGDVDVTEINLSDMDPEDIRSELKRLYTQLQIYRTKTMRKDNPHISKRRGGRKQTHRRFSLQAFHHKHRHPHHHENDDHEISKTPEESTNSAEGVGYSIEESTCSVGELSDRRNPTVTFKPGHKSFC